MEIQDPQLYKGQLRVNRKNSWLNCHKVWVVNGEINKIDLEGLLGPSRASLGGLSMLGCEWRCKGQINNIVQALNPKFWAPEGCFSR